MSRDIAFWAGGFAWLTCVLVAVGGWERYDATPGPAGLAAEMADRGPQPGWRLTAFVHPHCPCSRATVEQLASLKGECPRLPVRVVVVRPRGTPAGWERGPLWSEAERLDGVTVACDVDGTEARAAGAATSGEVVLTDPSGRAVFRGGLTTGRGRGRDGDGRRAVLEWVRGEAAAPSAPVYGCPLHTPDE